MDMSSTKKTVCDKRDAIDRWLSLEAPYTAADQRHLDAHTPEQAYWHLGYRSALADVLRLLSTDHHRGTEDT